jgi:hypothetical protein
MIPGVAGLAGAMPAGSLLAPRESASSPSPASATQEDEAACDGRAWLERTVRAFGGEKAIRTHPRHYYRGTTETRTPSGISKGEIEVYYQEPDRLRIEITGDIIDMVQVLRGERAWVEVGGRVSESTPETAANVARTLRYQYDRLALNYRRMGYEVTGCSEETEGFRRYIRVDLEDEDGDQVALGLYPDTRLVRYVEFRSSGPMPGGRVIQRTVYEDYREVDGMKTAFEITTYQNGMQRTSTTLEEMDRTPDFEPGLFEAPEASE